MLFAGVYLKVYSFDMFIVMFTFLGHFLVDFDEKACFCKYVIVLNK